MTQQAAVEKQTIGVGDQIATEVIAQGIDEIDFTLWLTVQKVLTDQDGARHFRCAFPDGSLMMSLVPLSTVTRFRSQICELCDMFSPNGELHITCAQAEEMAFRRAA